MTALSASRYVLVVVVIVVVVVVGELALEAEKMARGTVFKGTT